MSKELINLSNLQRFLSKLNEKFALKKAMKGISEDSEGNIIIGEEGLVPTPNENSKGKFLRSDGEWALPSETAVYDSMTLEEGVAGVSKVDRVINAKNLKQIVNSDGFLTSLDSSKLTGIINIENLPQGALERILIVSSKEERLTLLDTEVQLGDVVKEVDTGLMYYVINTEKLNSEEGYTQFTAGSASSVPWSGVTDKPTIPTKTSDLTNDSDFAVDNNVVHTSGDETIAGIKTFSDITISNKELHYKDTKYDWTDTSLNVWCNAGHVVWFDKTGNRRMHELVGANGGVWRKSCYINENQYFSVDSNKNISYAGVSFKFNGKNVALDENLVHRSGNETINGTKIFYDTIYRQADISTSTVETVYILEDTNAKPCGSIYNKMHWYNNNVYNRHQSYNATSGKDMYLEILSDNDGSGVVNTGGSVTNNKNLTTVTDSTNNSYVATMGWVNNPATSTNVVHRSGDETIDGTKIFYDTISRHSDLTTSGWAQVYNFYDINTNSCGHIYNNVHWHDNVVFNRHGAYNAKSGKTMDIDITSNDAGVGMAYVVGTATNGNLVTVTSETGHTGIATMGWVNNPATSTNVVHRSGDETIAGNKTFSNQISFPSEYFITTDTNDNSLRIVRHGTGHGNNYKIIIQGDTGKIFAPNGFIGNLQGNADTATSAGSATKSSCLDSYSLPGGNKIYLDWDGQVKSYVGLKVDNTTMGGLITTKNIGSQSVSSATYATSAGSANSVAWANVTGKPNLAGTTFVKGTNYWYRKHSDGFIEMGGFTDCAYNKEQSVVATNLPLAFSNTNYTLLVQLTRGTNDGGRWGDGFMCSFTQRKTTTGFKVYSYLLTDTGVGGYDWYACGY